jgi:hypothetical protein
VGTAEDPCIGRPAVLSQCHINSQALRGQQRTPSWFHFASSIVLRKANSHQRRAFFSTKACRTPPPPKAKTMALAALGNTYFDRPSTRPLVPSAAFGPVALNGWLYHQFKRRTRLLRACRPGFGDEVRNGVGHSLSIRRTQPLWVNRSKCAWDPCHSNGVYSVEGVWL